MTAVRAPSAEDQIRLRALNDFIWYAETFLWIEDKQTRKLVRLTVKPVQRRLAKKILDDWASGVPVRIIVLKARREGVSTIVQALFFWLASLRKHQTAVTLSHHDRTTGELHAISERFYRKCPASLRPMRRQSRLGSVMEFANPSKNDAEVSRNPGLESKMSTITAKNAGAGTGANLVHCSEVGLYEENQIDAATVLLTLLQIVPTAPHTIVILESTARGVGNEFYKRWIQAEESLAEGVDDFYPFFIAWFEEPTNVIAEGGDLGELSDRELRLRSRFGCSDEQVAWRRYAIRALCGGDEDKFDQEYPESPEVAFLASGRPYFDQQSVKDALDAARDVKPWRRGDLVEDGNVVRMVDSKRGRLTVWEPPQEDEDYLISCDSSEGSGGDPQTARVFKRSALEVVAAWHGHVDRAELGHILYDLGVVYRTALIAVEINGGWGATPIAILRERRYWRLFRSAGVNKVKRKREVRWGWDTTPTNRALILDALGTAIRNGELVDHDPELYKECLVFAYSETGKPQAQPGKHDDRVMAEAIGVYLWQTEPRRAVQKPQPDRRVLQESTGY